MHQNCIDIGLDWILKTQCLDVPRQTYLPNLTWKAILLHGESPSISQNALDILIHCTRIGEMQIQEYSSSALRTNLVDLPIRDACECVLSNFTAWNEQSLFVISNLVEKHPNNVVIHEKVLRLLETILTPPEIANDPDLPDRNSHSIRVQSYYGIICRLVYPRLIIESLRKVHDGNGGLLRAALTVMSRILAYGNVQ